MAFEIPIFTMLIVLSGITTVEELRQKRPYVIVACFVIGMLLTPPDPFSQSMLAIPMCLLFELGLILGRLVDKVKQENEEREQTERGEADAESKTESAK